MIPDFPYDLHETIRHLLFWLDSPILDDIIQVL